MSPSGQFDIAYTSFSNGYQVFLTRYDANGAVIDGNQHDILIGSNGAVLPSVAMDDFGNAVVSYVQNYSVKARRVFNEGLGPEITIKDNIGIVWPESSVALNHANGSFVVAYQSSTSRGGPFIEVAKVGASNAIQASYDVLGDVSRPALSVNNNGDYMLAYTTTHSDEINGTDTNIAARRGHLS
jgi:hypothetical protein